MFCSVAPSECFHYTSQGECVTIDDVDDQSEFTTTKEALRFVGFHDDQLRGIFRVLSAILHLGNVEVGTCDKDGEVMSVIGEDDNSLVTSATLLGVDPAHLAHWLSHRKITTRIEVYHKPLTHAQVYIVLVMYMYMTRSQGKDTHPRQLSLFSKKSQPWLHCTLYA